MSRNDRAILEAAIALPEAQRVRLIKNLVASLSHPEKFWEQELAAELNRRHKDIGKKAEIVSWVDLKRQLAT